MNKLQGLTAYLLEANLVMPEQLDSWVDQVNLDLIWKPTGAGGMHMGDMRYRAVLGLERFTGNPSLLMALVGCWLESNDSDRGDDLPVPAFVVEPLDNDVFDVELTIEFEEEQHLVEDPDGQITSGGKRYGLGQAELWVAEHGEVKHGA
ncbi:phage tail protein [Pseudomonas sp. Irchel 3E13]|uniref:phage tail protein n=1 Tax=Pseudomonas sp. Irchel 3E13 TaxID=2008975 RepID=UPI000BA4D53A|nr:phage tail protein [Pseudomonas sp. Irchel 3E13]